MNSKQFTTALTRLGQTNQSFADLITTESRTVRRWASGEYPVPTPVAMLLNLMADTKSTVEDLRV